MNRRLPPFKYNHIMSKHHFDEIMQELKYTQFDPPEYCNGFWEIRELQDAWNLNMQEEFSPDWLLCLDESMSKWINKWTCPGQMVVPRKPWSFGNKYNTIACSICGILYQAEMREGKSAPRGRPPKEYASLGKTTSLVLRLTKNLYGSGSIVVMDSGFYVVKAIVELRKKGIFSSALIKKRRYWPKYVDGDAFNAHFENKDVDSFDALKSKLDGETFYLYSMKEPDYVMKFMTTFGTENWMGKEQVRLVQVDGVTRKFCFQYPEICHLHYKNQDAVDANNARRMFPIAL